jgi:hypothetical protein
MGYGWWAPVGHAWGGLLVLLIVALLVILIVRRERLPDDAFSGRNFLRVYLRLAFLIAILLGVIGASMAITGVFSAAFGKDFAYGPTAVNFSGYQCATSGSERLPVPRIPLFTPPVLGRPPFVQPVHPGQLVPCAENFLGRNPGLAAALQPRQERDLAVGLALLVVAVAFAALHKYLTARVETATERAGSRLAWLEGLVGLFGFGLAALVAIAVALPHLFGWLVVTDRRTMGGGPGAGLAASIVLAAAAAYFLAQALSRASKPPPAG